jgi:hypothetical protein
MTAIRIGLLVGLLLFGSHSAMAEEEKSRSPFSRSPADVAKDEPCRFMGTFHKESRRRLEALFSCHVISIEQWKCMANELKTLDKEMTNRCKEKPQALETIEARQTELYRTCLLPSGDAISRCSLLSSDRACLTDLCSAKTSPERESNTTEGLR